nr:immunoglobulin light chain junction region [Macaca mulatta]
YQQYSDFLLTF